MKPRIGEGCVQGHSVSWGRSKSGHPGAGLFAELQFTEHPGCGVWRQETSVGRTRIGPRSVGGERPSGAAAGGGGGGCTCPRDGREAGVESGPRGSAPRGSARTARGSSSRAPGRPRLVQPPPALRAWGRGAGKGLCSPLVALAPRGGPVSGPEGPRLARSHGALVPAAPFNPSFGWLAEPELCHCCPARQERW